ncbi:unnamed protein product [Notodromas monacha]|uniref:Ig-like domain-containing protein n=1 Tax=Notodromas monacha TaxID=399045 RepID=A0A7R9BXB5_9CRUS|nr:unnamed protein product [Notodromas monacha]CAG0922523.1 unnamed protein product [Notodromas monacha]
MATIISWAGLIGIAQAAAGIRSTIIEPSVVRAGQRVNFTCIMEDNIAFETGGCVWSGPRQQVAPRLAPSSSGIVAVGSSSDRGTCSFYIEQVDERLHNGDWACNPIMEKNENIPSDELVWLNLTVAVKPNPPRPTMHMDSYMPITDTRSQITVIEAQEQEVRNFTCVSRATRPCPAFEWYFASENDLHLEPIMQDQVTWTKLLDDPQGDKKLPLYDCYSTIVLQMDAGMNSNKLRCYATHAALEENECSTEAKCNVRGSPRVRQCNDTVTDSFSIVDSFICDQQSFLFHTGKTARVSILFSSHPEPTEVRWIIPQLSQPLIGVASSKGYSSTWGKADIDDPLGYWDRSDLYWANLSIKGYSTRKEGDGFALEVSNGFEAPQGEPDRNWNNQQQQQQQQRINLDQTLLPAEKPGVSPRNTAYMRYTFKIQSLPGAKEAGLSGGVVAAVVLACISAVVIIVVLVIAKSRNLWCFGQKFAPNSSMADYLRHSFRSMSWQRSKQRYDGVVIDDEPDAKEHLEPEGSTGNATTTSASTSAESDEKKTQRPTRPPPPPPDDLSSLEEGVV